MVGVVPHFTSNSNKIVALAARHKIPAMYPFPVYAFRGGLMSYGADFLGMPSPSRPRLCLEDPLRAPNPPIYLLQRPNKFELVDQPQDRQSRSASKCRTYAARCCADEVIE